MRHFNLKYFWTFLLLFAQLPVLHAQEKGLDERINEAFTPQPIGGSGAPQLSWDEYPNHNLFIGGRAAFFTLYFGFVNVRRFPTAINTVRENITQLITTRQEAIWLYQEILYHQRRKSGRRSKSFPGSSNCRFRYCWEWKYCRSSPSHCRGISRGNLLMIQVDFWDVNKICGVYLRVKYRDVGEDGTVYGVPMYYLTKGLQERGSKRKHLESSLQFCIGASFGGGSTAQSNQAAMQLVDSFGMTGVGCTIIGLIMMVLVGIIIIGGIKRIASVTEK